jgi:putative methyltransferase (TIGR04325 family)
VLSFPEGTTWTVIDLPAIISRGRQFAVEQRATNALRFSTDLAAIDGQDVLFASGSLQYLPKRLPELLSGLEAPPQRLILNLTAVHPELGFYTVNSFGSGFAAYRIEARNALVADIEAAGYHLRDEWKCVNKPFHMPLTPELDFDSYSGFCFDRVPAHD